MEVKVCWISYLVGSICSWYRVLWPLPASTAAGLHAKPPTYSPHSFHLSPISLPLPPSISLFLSFPSLSLALSISSSLPIPPCQASRGGGAPHRQHQQPGGRSKGESLLRVVGSLRPSLRRSRAGVVAICSGKLSAKAKHTKHSKTQEGEVFRTQTLVLGELER